MEQAGGSETLYSLEVGLVTWANHSALTLGFQETYEPELLLRLPLCQGIWRGAEIISLIAKDVQVSIFSPTFLVTGVPHKSHQLRSR